MTTIIGVDFSGAYPEDGKTWVAQGQLSEDGTLLLDSVQPALREDLYQWVACVVPPAVVAMDFPFGVPRVFAQYLDANAQLSQMPDVWRIVGGKDRNAFIAARDGFVRARGKPRRYGDAAHRPESFSPLHKAYTNMVPMTYEGICLLRRWHQDHPQRWYVPPLDAPAERSDAVTLLEVMPGAFLKSIELPRGNPGRAYKSRHAVDRREEIIVGLAEESGIALPNLDSVRMGCRANDDCLDAVVAAVCAAAWECDRPRFHHPADGAELDCARLEGWIYTFLPNH